MEHRPTRQPGRDLDSAATFEAMFELAPVSLWVEDYSELKKLFDEWRAQGVIDLRTHVGGHPERIVECSRRLRVVNVNRRTLELYGARNVTHLVENLDRVFRDDMFDQHLEELVQLWENGTRFSSETVNYTLAGDRIDISLHATVLPGFEATWERILVAIEDVTERAQAQRDLARSELYSRGLFEHSPVSLWVEDFSGVKRLLDEVRAQGITEFRTFTDVHPEFVTRCMRDIRVLDVNQETLAMFAAADKASLLKRLPEVFRDEMRVHFAEQLIDLWDRKLFQRREVVNYALSGDKLNVYLQFAVFPGYEATWEYVLISLTDITARKKAEAYLEFLGKHDALTQLCNRSFFEEDLARLERHETQPVTLLVADLNGLKAVNDGMGHAAGDALLRRTGEVLREAVGPEVTAARIGGDEFAILLPATDERAGQQVIERIHALVKLNNQFYPGPKLNLSLGAATSRSGTRLEQTLSEADEQMYAAKKEYYSAAPHDRRS